MVRTGRSRPPSRQPVRPPAGGPHTATWLRLAREIGSCQRCPLFRTRQRVVIYRGAPHPRVLFVGEAPGAQEDREGVPFVGRAGARLDRAVQSIGLPVADFGVVNLVKCRPPANRLRVESVRACHPFLERQIELLGPAVIVPLGRHALASLLPAAGPVSSATGRPYRRGARWLFPLLHPAAPLHDPRRGPQWEKDLRALRRFLAGRRNPITRVPVARP